MAWCRSRTNPTTGSLLLRYDMARVRPQDIEDRVEERLKTLLDVHRPDETVRPDPETGQASRRLNRSAKLGMLGSLTATLLALTVGKRLHAASGALYLAFLAVHLANHRKNLLK